jgi:hypothetical protein
MTLHWLKHLRQTTQKHELAYNPDVGYYTSKELAGKGVTKASLAIAKEAAADAVEEKEAREEAAAKAKATAQKVGFAQSEVADDRQHFLFHAPANAHVQITYTSTTTSAAVDSDNHNDRKRDSGIDSGISIEARGKLAVSYDCIQGLWRSETWKGPNSDQYEISATVVVPGAEDSAMTYSTTPREAMSQCALACD